MNREFIIDVAEKEFMAKLILGGQRSRALKNKLRTIKTEYKMGGEASPPRQEKFIADVVEKIEDLIGEIICEKNMTYDEVIKKIIEPICSREIIDW